MSENNNELVGLTFVIQYRRKDDGIEWTPMAAFDGGLAARRYLEAQDTRPEWPWEYRMIELTSPEDKHE